MSISIKPVMPVQALVSPQTSSSKFIVNKTYREFAPQSQVSFSYKTNSVIEFDISSPSDFINFANSYIRANINCTLLNNGVDDPNKYLGEGGVHSLIRSVVVSSQSGTELARIDTYNKLHSIISNMTVDKEYAEHTLQREADSVEYEGCLDSELCDVDYTVASAGYTAATGALIGLIGVYANLRVGDIITVSSATAGESKTARVITLTSDTAVVITPGGADIAVGDVTAVQNQKVEEQAPVRKLAANTADYQVAFQLSVPLLQMDDYFPLFLLRGGLKIRIYLERSEYSLCSTSVPTGTGFTGSDVVVSNPRFVGEMITPSQELSEKFVDMYRSEGLTYNYLTFRHQQSIQQGGAASSYSITFSPNFRSAKHLLMMIQDKRANQVSTATANQGKQTICVDASAQGLKSSLEEIQLAIGSHRYPSSRPMDTSSGSNAELLLEAERCFGSLSVKNSGKRFDPVLWRAFASRVNPTQVGVGAGKADSQRLSLCFDLARHFSPYSGVDLSLNYVEIDTRFSAQASISDMSGSNSENTDRYFEIFVSADSVLSISESEGVLVMN